MERASQVLSDICIKTLTDFKKNISSTSNFEKLSYKDSFKYSLLHEAQIKIEIKTHSSFAIYEGEIDLPTVNGPAITEARLTDFLLGAYRVKTHYQDLLKAKDAHTSSAWLLVTAYYCSFFACIELLKINNQISIGFDSDDLKLLAVRATGVEKLAFFNGKSFNFVGRIKANKFVFDSNGGKPHAAAWQQLLPAISGIYSGRIWPEIESLKKILSTGILNPSKIRNNWNYKRPDYFGSAGESFGVQFKKLLNNPKGATEWLIRNGISAAPDDSSRIAAICELLAPAIIDAYNRMRQPSPV